MKRLESLLLIGGASRNVGKTTLISKIIEKFSTNNAIVGLKIKTITNDDSYFHGKDSDKIFDKYLLSEENLSDSANDSGKMLKAGAQKSFLLRSKSEFLEEAFQFFLSTIGEKELIVCESNSLRKYFVPDLYLLIKHSNHGNMKPSAEEVESYADKIIISDGLQHNFGSKDLKIENHKWILA